MRWKFKGMQVQLDGAALPPKEQVNSMGVLLDPVLLLSRQHQGQEHFCPASTGAPGIDLPQTHRTGHSSHSLVTSWPYNCHTLCVRLPLKRLQKLQLMLMEAMHEEHITVLSFFRTTLASHLFPAIYRVLKRSLAGLPDTTQQEA